MEMVKLTIDNKPVEIEKGSTIYEAAKKVGIEIPVLCHMNLHKLNVNNKAAACRICVVEVAGRKNLAPSCATDVTEGMVVRTNSLRVLHARRTIMELILSDHPKTV